MTQSQPDSLPATPLFAGVDNEDWPELLGHSTRLDLAPGAAIFRQGEAGDAFFVVIAGLVEVRARAAAGGTEKTLAHLGAGAILGETSLFLGDEHSASVYAAEPTTVLRFRTDGFMEMIRTRHRGAIQVLYNIGYSLAVRLRAADDRLTSGSVASPGAFIANTDRSRRLL